ncbi:protein SCO1/2 [Spirosomataceae bacterium TFI 002]|nr:protein SCO1/2 [Spirosomataceae bacterium TFI 002]
MSTQKKPKNFYSSKALLLVIIANISIFSCTSTEQELPILGPRYANEMGDTVYHKIPEFSFINQEGDEITEKDYNGKIYVSDFFFTSCPTICPVMKSQMLRVYEHFKDNPAVGLLSHTIDPIHDSIQVLHDYASALGVHGNQWNFVTGVQDSIYNIAQKSYMVSAMEDSTAIEDGGFIHSGAFLLIDKQKRVRGQYDGTVEKQVSQLIRDMELLLKEEENEK